MKNFESFFVKILLLVSTFFLSIFAYYYMDSGKELITVLLIYLPFAFAVLWSEVVNYYKDKNNKPY
ncbi:hypothetical protein DA469_22275 [Bacillus subtilis]|nr:hypothetical protein DA469_22275 [Bacillus subtilis]